MVAFSGLYGALCLRQSSMAMETEKGWGTRCLCFKMYADYSGFEVPLSPKERMQERYPPSPLKPPYSRSWMKEFPAGNSYYCLTAMQMYRVSCVFHLDQIMSDAEYKTLPKFWLTNTDTLQFHCHNSQRLFVYLGMLYGSHTTFGYISLLAFMRFSWQTSPIALWKRYFRLSYNTTRELGCHSGDIHMVARRDHLLHGRT